MYNPRSRFFWTRMGVGVDDAFIVSLRINEIEKDLYQYVG